MQGSALSVVGSLPTKGFRMKMKTFKSHINLPLWLLEESPGGLACQFGRALESFRGICPKRDRSTLVGYGVPANPDPRTRAAVLGADLPLENCSSLALQTRPTQPPRLLLTLLSLV